MNVNPRIMIMGHGRHGKDSVCEIIQSHYGFNFISSSELAMQLVIWPTIGKHYISKAECFADRHNWRSLWYQLIKRYNTPDQTRLGREIFARADVYCGIRQADEFHAMKDAGLFDFAIWVDASKRMAMESSESMTVNRSMCDFVIDNNGPAHELPYRTRAVIDGLKFSKASHRI